MEHETHLACAIQVAEHAVPAAVQYNLLQGCTPAAAASATSSSPACACSRPCCLLGGQGHEGRKPAGAGERGRWNSKTGVSALEKQARRSS